MPVRDARRAAATVGVGRLRRPPRPGAAARSSTSRRVRNIGEQATAARSPSATSTRLLREVRVALQFVDLLRKPSTPAAPRSTAAEARRDRPRRRGGRSARRAGAANRRRRTAGSGRCRCPCGTTRRPGRAGRREDDEAQDVARRPASADRQVLDGSRCSADPTAASASTTTSNRRMASSTASSPGPSAACARQRGGAARAAARRPSNAPRSRSRKYGASVNGRYGRPSSRRGRPAVRQDDAYPLGGGQVH